VLPHRWWASASVVGVIVEAHEGRRPKIVVFSTGVCTLRLPANMIADDAEEVEALAERVEDETGTPARTMRGTFSRSASGAWCVILHDGISGRFFQAYKKSA